MKRFPFFLIPLVITGCSPVNPPVHVKGDLYVAAWYAAYASGGYDTFKDHYWLFDEINPVWYNLNPDYFEDGQAPIVHTYNAEKDKNAIITLARKHGIKLVPSIQNWGENNFDDQVLVKIIQDPGKRAKHVREIVDLVTENGYDGIDIDYEALRTSARGDFSAFIAELGEELHKRGKLLSVAVYAKTFDAQWAGAGAQDWAELAKYADSLKIMGYDFHWSTQHPGPLAPLDWLEKVLIYAQGIPEVKGKLIVGLPLYGLNWEAWKTSDDRGPAASEAMYEGDKGAIALRNKYKSEVKRDNTRHYPCNCNFSTNVEPYFIYYDEAGKKHIVYYQNAKATRARLELIKKYRHLVKGITFWRLGREDPEIWQVVAEYSKSITGEK